MTPGAYQQSTRQSGGRIASAAHTLRMRVTPVLHVHRATSGAAPEYLLLRVTPFCALFVLGLNLPWESSAFVLGHTFFLPL